MVRNKILLIFFNFQNFIWINIYLYFFFFLNKGSNFPNKSKDIIIQILFKNKSKVYETHYFYPQTKLECENWKSVLRNNGSKFDSTISNQIIPLSLSSSLDLTELKKVLNNQSIKDDFKKYLKEDKKLYKSFLKQLNKNLNSILSPNEEELFYNQYFDIETVKNLIFNSKEEDPLYDYFDEIIPNKNSSFPIKLFVSLPDEENNDSMIEESEKSNENFGFLDIGIQISNKFFI